MKRCIVILMVFLTLVFSVSSLIGCNEQSDSVKPIILNSSMGGKEIYELIESADSFTVLETWDIYTHETYYVGNGYFEKEWRTRFPNYGGYFAEYIKDGWLYNKGGSQDEMDKCNLSGINDYDIKVLTRCDVLTWLKQVLLTGDYVWSIENNELIVVENDDEHVANTVVKNFNSTSATALYNEIKSLELSAEEIPADYLEEQKSFYYESGYLVCGGKTEHVHSSRGGRIIEAPTCEYLGTGEFVCCWCGETFEDSIDRLEHNYKLVSTTGKCTEGRVENYKCIDCGYETSKRIPATSHNFEDYYGLSFCTNCRTPKEVYPTFKFNENMVYYVTPGQMIVKIQASEGATSATLSIITYGTSYTADWLYNLNIIDGDDVEFSAGGKIMRTSFPYKDIKMYTYNITLSQPYDSSHTYYIYLGNFFKPNF